MNILLHRNNISMKKWKIQKNKARYMLQHIYLALFYKFVLYYRILTISVNSTSGY